MRGKGKGNGKRGLSREEMLAAAMLPSFLPPEEADQFHRELVESDEKGRYIRQSVARRGPRQRPLSFGKDDAQK